MYFEMRKYRGANTISGLKKEISLQTLHTSRMTVNHHKLFCACTCNNLDKMHRCLENTNLFVFSEIHSFQNKKTGHFLNLPRKPNN